MIANQPLTLPLPTFLLGGLLVLAVITYLLRGWEHGMAYLAALVTAGSAFWLGLLDPATSQRSLPLLGITVDNSMSLAHWGFTLQFRPSIQPMMVASLLLAAIAFLITTQISQGRTFIPFAFVLLAGYLGLAMMSAGPMTPVLLTPIFLVILAAVSIFALQAGRLVNPTGPLRILIPPILAFPLFLVAAWYIEQIPLNPQDHSAEQMAAMLMTMGLLLLLSPVPFHSAQPATMQTAPPLAVTFVTLLNQLFLLYFAYQLINSFPFISQTLFYERWFTWAGLATAIWGGIAAAGALHPGRVWGYTALHDWGLVLMLFANPTSYSWPLLLFLFALRSVSMLTAAAGLMTLEQHAGGLSPIQLQGAGNRLPWNSAALLLGGLGLTGFPLSAGFTSHWTALQLIAATDWRQAVLILLASVGAIWGFVRLARVLFGPLANPLLIREQVLNALCAVVLLLLSISLAVAPQLLDAPIRAAWIALRS